MENTMPKTQYTAEELRELQQQWLDGQISFFEYIAIIVMVEGQIEQARADMELTYRTEF
jgi:hypothetical protein